MPKHSFSEDIFTKSTFGRTLVRVFSYLTVKMGQSKVIFVYIDIYRLRFFILRKYWVIRTEKSPVHVTARGLDKT